MSACKTDTDHTALGSAPLFASVWLALFYKLRRNYATQQSTDLNSESTKHQTKAKLKPGE